MLLLERPAQRWRLARLCRYLAALEAAHLRLSKCPHAHADPDSAACLMVLEEEILIADLLVQAEAFAADHAAVDVACPGACA